MTKYCVYNEDLKISPHIFPIVVRNSINVDTFEPDYKDRWILESDIKSVTRIYQRYDRANIARPLEICRYLVFLSRYEPIFYFVVVKYAKHVRHINTQVHIPIEIMKDILTELYLFKSSQLFS